MNPITTFCVTMKREFASLRDSPALDALRIVCGLVSVAIAVWLVLALLTFGK